MEIQNHYSKYINLPLNKGGITQKDLASAIKYGLDVNHKNELGDTLLHKLAFKNDFDAETNKENVLKATMLINKGANLYLRDKEGYTPIDVADNNNKRDILELYCRKLNNDLFTYATDGNTEKMKEMINHGANIRADDDAAIRYASFFNKWDAVKVLIENGADITADDNLPVKSASENGNFIMTKYLVERGADLNSAIKVADESIKLELIALKEKTTDNVVSNKNDKVLQQAL